ncbi:hypothetical protein [Exiguobacterium profundum]|uniref:hypothetical protein n=1 Tax=Exiguobacterium profundum TaxID=307643 RepID=UPI0035169827
MAQTCGDRIDPATASQYIAEGLDAKVREDVKLERGMGPIRVPEAQVAISK